jgi:hypothetical protein
VVQKITFSAFFAFRTPTTNNQQPTPFSKKLPSSALSTNATIGQKIHHKTFA